MVSSSNAFFSSEQESSIIPLSIRSHDDLLNVHIKKTRKMGTVQAGKFKRNTDRQREGKCGTKRPMANLIKPLRS